MDKIPHEGRGALNMYSMTYDEHLLILKKLDEIVEWINGVDRQLTELYQQQEQLLKHNKLGYWKREEGGDEG